MADAYEAMTSDRPYRLSLSRAEARAELEDRARCTVDARVLDAFLLHLDEGCLPVAGTPAFPLIDLVAPPGRRSTLGRTTLRLAPATSTFGGRTATRCL